MTDAASVGVWPGDTEANADFCYVFPGNVGFTDLRGYGVMLSNLLQNLQKIRFALIFQAIACNEI